MPPALTDEEIAARDQPPPGTVLQSAPPGVGFTPSPGARFYQPGEGQTRTLTAPAPLPSVDEQQRRWETPYDRQLANDFASEQAGLQEAQQQLQQTAGTNRNISAQREAVKSATEFVRRKDTERMVRSGVPIEEAEFKSRLKYNVPIPKGMEPVRPPTPMTLDGVRGFTHGKGDQFTPFPQPKAVPPTQDQKLAISYHGKMRNAGIKLRAKLIEAQNEYQLAQDPNSKNHDSLSVVATNLRNAERAYADQQALTVKSREAMNAPASNGSLSHPKVGDVYKGHKFKGGSPADKNSWETVQ